MTVPADYPAKRTELLDKLAGVLRAFRKTMTIDGAVAPQEYVAWWSGLDRGIVGAVERGQRDVGFTKLRHVLLAYNATWATFGAAMGEVDSIPIVTIAQAPHPRLERSRVIVGRPILRPLAMTLYQQRVELGQTQESMSLLGGLDRGFVSSVERAERSVGFVKLRDVLAAYKMTWRMFGRAMNERDAIQTYERFPAWPGCRALLRSDPLPAWGPAVQRMQRDAHASTVPQTCAGVWPVLDSRQRSAPLMTRRSNYAQHPPRTEYVRLAL